MQVPIIRGIIDRRILVNYRIEPGVLQKLLPEPFEPKLVHGMGIAGVCLIRLKDIRPRGLPAMFGLSSENAAHRIAVVWEENGKRREGVYIPRRDTSSRLNTFIGGRLFPGVHHRARFQVSEDEDYFKVVLDSDDSQTHLAVEARATATLTSTSIFSTLAEASAFFEGGSLGYSPAMQSETFDGLELRSFNWQVEPLVVSYVKSSFFEDKNLCPPGSAEFDCALLMRGIDHEWHRHEPLCLPQESHLRSN